MIWNRLQTSGLLATVLLLMVLSTSYDLICSIYNRKSCNFYVQAMNWKKRFFNFRRKVPNFVGILHLHKWFEIDVMQKINVTRHDALFEWDSCHINHVDRARTHNVDVYGITISQRNRYEIGNLKKNYIPFSIV